MLIHMKGFRMEYKYTNGLVSEGFFIKGKPAPSSCVMAWCMIATGFNRIFENEYHIIALRFIKGVRYENTRHTS